MFITDVRYCRQKKKKYTKKSGFAVIFLSSILLCACQNSTQKTAGVTKGQIQSAERPLQILRSMDGIQDVHWVLTQIQGDKARYFHSEPFLLFNTQTRQMQGNTGCNTLSGSYEMNVPQRSVHIQARAGYFSCDQALAQEAMLMDLLGQVDRFQLQGNHLTLLSKSGQVLMQAKKK